MNSVVFVELNPYLSRLHVLRPLLEGASKRYVVHLIVPARDAGGDFDDFLASAPKQLRTYHLASHVSADGKVATAVVADALRCLRHLRSTEGVGVIKSVVWTAIDDYMGAIPLVALSRLIIGRSVSIIVIRYRIEDLLPESRVLIRAKKALALTMLKLVGTDWWIFDERVRLRRNWRAIVDPWEGPFRPRSAEEDFASRPMVLLVGRQDERKGFGAAVPALLRAKELRPGFAVRIIGRVDERYKNELAELRQAFGPLLTHETRYLSDAELAAEFRQARGVLMPYAPSFLGTSGVLVRAAATGVPVVGPQDGLIGYRIRNYSLGFAVDTSRVENISSAIVIMLDEEFDPSSALAFARRSRAAALSGWTSTTL